jgi:hypothetical protein
MTNLRYKRVSRKRNCLICGKPDWCSFTPDETISFCARITCGADRVSKTGWGVYYHDGSPQLLRPFPSPIPFSYVRNKRKSTNAQTPIWIKDFVYRKLIELAPASNSDDIISGPKGLNRRKILDLKNYGSLPQSVSERTALAQIIADMVHGRFPDLAKKLNTGPAAALAE